MYTQQTGRAGKPIPMTLGWHIGETKGERFFFKEDGGGGFHGEMRKYHSRNRASLTIANSTGFNASRFLNRMDTAFMEP